MEHLSSPDVASRYGIPLRTVQSACRTGAIKASRFGRMWLIPTDEAEAYAEAWRPRNGKEHMVEDDQYTMAEENVVRQDLHWPGRAVWKVDPDNPTRRVLNPSGLVGFDEYQPRAWQEVKELFDVSRLSAPETANGPGSTIALTEGIRGWLPGLFVKYGIHAILDAPCGDLNWMRLVHMTGVETYIGWDVVDSVVQQAADRGQTNGIGPRQCTFDCVNLLTVEEVPRVDLILSRDFLAHLPNGPALKVVAKFKASGSRYLLTSHYPDADNQFVYDPKDYMWVGYAERPINLEAEPFSLGKPVESFPEEPGPAGVIAHPHELALFEL